MKESRPITHVIGDSADNYRQAFLTIGTNDLIPDIGQIGPLTPVFVKNGSAEYYFEKNIEGHTILFPVEFMKENCLFLYGNTKCKVPFKLIHENQPIRTFIYSISDF